MPEPMASTMHQATTVDLLSTPFGTARDLLSHCCTLAFVLQQTRMPEKQSIMHCHRDKKTIKYSQGMQYKWWDVQADRMQPECTLYQLILKLWSMCHWNGCAYTYKIPALKLWKPCPSSYLNIKAKKKKRQTFRSFWVIWLCNAASITKRL